MGALASDGHLVHTVYYRHPDALDQIANHLVRSAEDLYDLCDERRTQKWAARRSGSRLRSLAEPDGPLLLTARILIHLVFRAAGLVSPLALDPQRKGKPMNIRAISARRLSPF